MKISDLFGRTSVYGNSKSSAAGKNEEADASSSRIGNEEGADRTTISSKARVLSQVSQIREDEEGTQAKRVADLKKRVESGEYSVSSDAVAKKLVAFFDERA